MARVELSYNEMYRLALAADARADDLEAAGSAVAETYRSAAEDLCQRWCDAERERVGNPAATIDVLAGTS